MGRVFGRDRTTGQFRLLDAEMLTREKIDELCDGGVEALQKLINKAVEETMLYRDRLSPSQYGTGVHSKVEHKIKFNTEHNKNPKGFVPEISFVKMSEEAARTADANNPPIYEQGDRGEKGSIRLDILQPVLKKRTVCVHDIKTLRKGLSRARIGEINRRVSGTKEYRDVDLIVVTEARPSDGWRMGRRLKR